MNRTFRLILSLAVLALPAFTRGIPSASAQATAPVHSYIVSGSTAEADLARLREAIGKVSGVEQVELNGRSGGAMLRIRGKAEAATLMVAAKSAGFDLQPPPLRSYIATGSSRDEDIDRLREALRKLDGMEQFEVRGQNGGATVHVQGDMKGSDLVSAAKSVGYELRAFNTYSASGPSTDTDIKRLSVALKKVEGVEQIETHGLAGGAKLLIQGDTDPAALVDAAKSAGFELRMLTPASSGRRSNGDDVTETSNISEEAVECNTFPAYAERNPENLTRNVGELAPDFTLLSRDGSSKISLSGYRGKKPVVLLFGSYTCPPFRARIVLLEQLYQKYKDRVEFLLVYVREAHPNSILFVPAEGGGKMLQVIAQTSTAAERLKHLQLCTSYLQLTMPALIDSEDNVANRAYAAFPSRFYVIDKDGKIAVKGDPGPGGFRPADLETWLSANAK